MSQDFDGIVESSGKIGLYSDDSDKVNNENDFRSKLTGWIAITFSWVLVIMTFPVSLFYCVKVVQQYEKVVRFRFGRLQNVGSSGVFFVLPCIDSYTLVDKRSNVLEIPPQEVLTKDRVTVMVNAVVYYRISNAIMAVTNIEDPQGSTKRLAQTTLRGVLSKKTVQDLISERGTIAAAMTCTVNEVTDSWGVTVERIELVDILLPAELQKVMAIEGEAELEAKTRIISAESERQASLALKEAADALFASQGGIQLRYLETLKNITDDSKNTFNLTQPIQMLNGVINGSQPQLQLKQQPQQQSGQNQQLILLQEPQLEQQPQQKSEQNQQQPQQPTAQQENQAP